MSEIKSNKVQNFTFFRKITDLNKQWIRFINRKDWIPLNQTVPCELHSEEKHLRRGEKCTRYNCQ